MESPKMYSRKPKQKFEINFQEDITLILTKMTTDQIVRLFFVIASLLPLSYEFISLYQYEFKDFLRRIGDTLGDNIRKQIKSDRIPEIVDLANVSVNSDSEMKYPFISSFLSGLGGPLMDKNLSQNLMESIIKLVVPEYNSFLGWRDSLVFFVRTHSKATSSALSHMIAHPTYRQILHFMKKLKPSFNAVRSCEDVITTFDNEQKLKKSYRLGGAVNSNKMSISLCTMVLHLYPAIKTKIQFVPSLSPAKWLWNRRPDNFLEGETFKKALKNHKENWWNEILKQVWESVENDESGPTEAKRSKSERGERIENRRNLYEFAKSNHPEKPAEIEVGEPYDLNPSSYQDTKQIIRNESQKAGISKYGSGDRSWLTIVCDGSPFKLFLSLFNILFFCKSCKLPCGELKTHIDEVHGGRKDSIEMEFDHVLPLCGPGHVEKTILSAAISVLWDLIGFQKIAAVCNFKSKAQQEMLKKVKDHHISADFLIICLQTVSKEICYEFCKEWRKTNSHIPIFKDLKQYFKAGSTWISNVNLARMFSVVNGPLLSTFLLRVGVRCSNGPLYYGAMSECLSLLYHNKNSNYIRMLHFELFMIQNAPEPVKQFVMMNLFQRNPNHNNQNTAQGVDYKLEEYNKLFKHFEVSTAPSIEDWIKIASAAPQFKQIMEHQSKDYNIEFGIYSEPGAPDYQERIKSCIEMIRESGEMKSNSVKDLGNLDGKKLKKKETFEYEKEFKKRKDDYLKLVTMENSFIKAELAFNATSFIESENL